MNRLTKHWQSANIDWVLGFLFVAYSLFARYGYGNDDDTYRMLNTWNILITQGQYVSSRFQGYLIPEMAIGLASNLGGFLLANLTSVLLSIASLAIFYKMLSKVTTPRSRFSRFLQLPLIHFG
ncbi:MAG: hypothetical protein HC780_25670 [Leptolyngbyaceae cyanobacterium CSU_1_3]|nr:hypothetical protein [Leptolyngbyaceae cyanobacterium CSU_1_3]